MPTHKELKKMGRDFRERKRKKMTNAELGAALSTVKIGSKEQAFWSDVIKRTEMQLENLTKEIKISNVILVGAKQKLAEQEALSTPGAGEELTDTHEDTEASNVVEQDYLNDRE